MQMYLLTCVTTASEFHPPSWFGIPFISTCTTFYSAGSGNPKDTDTWDDHQMLPVAAD